MTLQRRRDRGSARRAAEGDGSIRVTGAAEPAAARAEHLALAMQPEYAEGLRRAARAPRSLWDGADWRALGLEARDLRAAPALRHGRGHPTLDRGPGIAPGIHPTALRRSHRQHRPRRADRALRGRRRRRPDRRARPDRRPCHHRRGRRRRRRRPVHAACPSASASRIGDRFIAQPGAVIGSDGFSFVTPETVGRRGGARQPGRPAARSRQQSWTPHPLARRGRDRRRRRDRRQHRHRPRHDPADTDRARHQDRQPGPGRPQRRDRARTACSAARSASPDRPGSATGWCWPASAASTTTSSSATT